ncbi:hypothetical protein FRC01_006188, partial [Tulasnella sp. 417]
ATYPQVKAQYPNEGRRRWKLRAAEEVWKASTAMEIEAKSEEIKKTQGVPALPWLVDKDPFDLDDGSSESRSVNMKGVIVRTDFSNDAAWDQFVAQVREAEKEGFSGLMAGPDEQEGGEEEGEDSESSDEEEEEEGAPQQMDVDPAGQGSSSSASQGDAPSVFHIINPAPTDPLRPLVENASNLRLLRLFNDVQIVPAPPKPRPPQGDLFSGMPKKKQQQPQAETKSSPNNRLVDKFGWKEVYPGRILWVFDAESNAAGSVRVVNSGDDSAYGSSTGDSWRARAAHIWELQVNMDSGALKIDFGGEDRWTGKERLRNYEELLR